MGTLIAMHYPTNLFADLADHTYVKCATGAKAWSCWGGKTGGTEIRRGAGSTNQADAIAEPNERARISCYLINGVCHQAANRILFAAGITVRGARGYDVSESLFGTYGRPRGPFGTCPSPFNQNTGVTGDMSECTGTVLAKAPQGRRTTRLVQSTKARKDEQRYLRGVLAIYRQAAPLTKGRARFLSGPELEGLHLKLFMHKVDYSVRTGLNRSLYRKLQDIRLSAERSRMKIEEWFGHQEMTVSDFVKAFNKETILFQEAAAGALKAKQYKALLGLEPGDTVILADPRIVRKAFKFRNR